MCGLHVWEFSFLYLQKGSAGAGESQDVSVSLLDN